MVYHSTVQPDNVQPSDFLVIACVLSLASNVEPSHHLAFAQTAINRLGQTEFSPIIVSPMAKLDKFSDKQQAIPSYHNQVVYLTFDLPIDYGELVKLTKTLEQHASRGAYQKPFVTLDVDVIAVKAPQGSSEWRDETGEALLAFANLPNWLGVARRFPLASYDKQGILALAKQTDLTFLPCISLSPISLLF